MIDLKRPIARPIFKAFFLIALLILVFVLSNWKAGDKAERDFQPTAVVGADRLVYLRPGDLSLELVSGTDDDQKILFPIGEPLPKLIFAGSVVSDRLPIFFEAGGRPKIGVLSLKTDPGLETVFDLEDDILIEDLALDQRVETLAYLTRRGTIVSPTVIDRLTAKKIELPKESSPLSARLWFSADSLNLALNAAEGFRLKSYSLNGFNLLESNSGRQGLLLGRLPSSDSLIFGSRLEAKNSIILKVVDKKNRTLVLTDGVLDQSPLALDDRGFYFHKVYDRNGKKLDQIWYQSLEGKAFKVADGLKPLGRLNRL